MAEFCHWKANVWFFLLLLISILLITGLEARAQLSIQILHSFAGDGPGPKNPHGALIEGPDGHLYGTSTHGGAYDRGVVYRITSTGVLTTLATFSPTNGSYPDARLVLARDGNFYGTTSGLYDNNFSGSTIFRVSPDGTLENVIIFKGTNSPVGQRPGGGLVLASNGGLWGTTLTGGVIPPYGRGTIYQLQTNSMLNSVFLFSNTNGAYPSAGLVQASDGNFYGTTTSGGEGYAGTDVLSEAAGFGCMFQITPNGNQRVLFSFNGSNGSTPDGGLVQAGDGNLYGTTSNGGIGFDRNGAQPPVVTGYGTVFRVTTNGVFTPLWQFDGKNGAHPIGDVVIGNDGALYGVTHNGGDLDLGTVFRITTNGLFTSLISLDGSTGYLPWSGLLQGTDGNLYGTTSYEGPGGAGTIFRLVAPISATLVAETGGNVKLSWNSFRGAAYKVEYATDPSPTSWLTLNPKLVATGEKSWVTDNAPGDAARYYRVVLLAP